jgi:hypothetical protein
MNQLYDIAVTSLLGGTLDLLNDPISVTPSSSTYFNPNHTVLGDLTGLLSATQPLTNRLAENRVLLADPTTFPAIPESDEIQSLIVHRTGTGAMVIAYIDRRPDLAPIWIQGNGGPVVVRWGGNSGMVIRL